MSWMSVLILSLIIYNLIESFIKNGQIRSNWPSEYNYKKTLIWFVVQFVLLYSIGFFKGFLLNLNWPQTVILGFMFYNLIEAVKNHGHLKPKISCQYSGLAYLLGLIITFSILWWGGVFR